MHMSYKNRGNISIMVLIFGLVFTTMAGALAIFGAVENTNAHRNEARTQALAIAEAGVNYYRWVLAHNPNDYQNGTGEPGPYEIDYRDPEGGVIGTYSLEVIPPEEGSRVVTIISTGWSSTYPNVRRTIRARFGPEPLTKYSFLHNANVWFGQGIIVYGEVLSNGGIRFDGINESLVRSYRETYTCGSETGCQPARTRPGVWGSGGPSDLWQYPVPSLDFDGIVTDFYSMRQAAQDNGVYLPPVSGHGYRIRFNNDGTFNVYRVNNAQNIRGRSVAGGCENLYQNITNETLIGSYQIEDNKIIYAEDTVWVNGTVSGEATVVAARLPVTTYTTNMWIHDNIEYASFDGSSNLGLIAQNDIYFARDVPNNFVVHAAMLAQQGSIMRHQYFAAGCAQPVAARIRNSLTVYGSIISNQKSYWNFETGSGLVSGFVNRSISYNQQAADNPPPYFPDAYAFRFLSWEEVQ